MAADKKIMAEIETLRLDRPGRMYNAAISTLPDAETVGLMLLAALRELAATYREEAELWSRSGAKGWKGSEAELYTVATHVDEVAAQLDNAGGGAALSVSDDALEAELRASAARIGDLQSADSLDKLIADSAAERRGMVRDEFLPDGHPARSDSGGDVTAYLSGAVDTLPGLAAALVPSSVHDMTTDGGIDKTAIEIAPPLDFTATIPAVGAFHDTADSPFIHGIADTSGLTDEQRAKLDLLHPYCGDCDHDQHRCHGCGEPVEHGKYACAQCEMIHAEPVADLGPVTPPTMPNTWESESMTADGLRKPGTVTAPLLGQPGDAGSGYSHTYVPAGGRVLRFDELLTPVPAAALPPHLSHSQIGDVGDCGVQYRLQRVDKMPQVPQWANIGGTAFHAAVESWERMAAQYPGISLNEEDCEGAWKHHFEEQIRIVAASSPVPISVWRASRKGAEGRAWWEVNGPLMLKRYLDKRPSDQTLTVDSSGTPAIEWEIMADVPTPYGPVSFKAVLDRVTVSPLPGTIIIRDYKTSYDRPTDTTQLGDYAWSLIVSGANLHGATRILGMYFDARRGEWTKPVDLLQEHPFEAFQYRVTAAHGQKRALTVGPTPARPSSYCGGCSVRYACPVMNQRAAVAPPPPAPVTP